MRRFFDRLVNALGWLLNGIAVLGLALTIHGGVSLWQ